MGIYTNGMYVQAPDNSFAQQALLTQVGTAVLAMSIRDARAMAERFDALMQTAETTVQVVRDQAVGRSVDLLG